MRSSGEMDSQRSEPPRVMGNEGRARRVATVLLFAVVALQYGWNAAAQPAFWGYDEGAHAAVAFGIAETGNLPHPLSGWSTFHPPVQAVLGAAVLTLLKSAPGWVALAGLRTLSLLGALALGAAVFLVVRRRFGFIAAWCTTALALFLPVTQLAASMVGNEALAAGFAALAMVALMALQRDPVDLRAAWVFGLCAGLACATKYSGAWTLSLAVLPFLRPEGVRAWRSFAVCVGVALLVAGPFYLRNVVTTGTPLPMTRNLQPMKHFEARMELRPRQVSDYLTIPWQCGQYPYITVIAEDGGSIAGFNPAMQNVPCMLHAGLWFDPFGIRGARTDAYSGVGWGVVLMLLGVGPTLLVLAGVLRGARRVVTTRGRAEETPLLALLLLGLGSFFAFSWMAPSLAAAKASYLLPLVMPAGFFFAAGAALFGARARFVVFASAAAIALFAAIVFTTGVVFPAANANASHAYWTRIGQVLPQSFIVPATNRLVGSDAASGESLGSD